MISSIKWLVYQKKINQVVMFTVRNLLVDLAAGHVPNGSLAFIIEQLEQYGKTHMLMKNYNFGVLLQFGNERDRTIFSQTHHHIIILKFSLAYLTFVFCFCLNHTTSAQT